MKNIKKNIIKQMERVLSMPIKKVYFAKQAPEIPLPKDMVPWPRFLVCLDGEMELMYTSHEGICQKKFAAGEALFFPTFCCSRSIWSSPHEQFSAVLRDEWLRVLYIDRRTASDKDDLHPVPDAYYHVKKYHEAIPNIFNTLSHLSEDDDPEIAKSLLICFLKLALKDIKSFRHDEPTPVLHCPVWPWILEYVHDNIGNYKLDRESIAEKFNLSPQYISRLFQKNAGRSLINYITQERLQKAEKLLKTSNMLVKAIAWECGYPCSSYFIKLFKKHYNITPSTYRRKVRKTR